MWDDTAVGYLGRDTRVRKMKRDDGGTGRVVSGLSDEYDPDEPQEQWKANLLVILQGLEPSAFERLSQRLLRENGFVDVAVTGRSGDGGIDGVGILRLGLLTFRVAFQCKRFKGSVGVAEVRDFRGALQGRAEKGILITTGNFTDGARREARRDGGDPIDLIDGDELCGILKDRRLGIETVESVELKPDFFYSL
jgi:restriction system protein